jgi:light-harvesting protein B-800-850 alpha chain
MNQGRIWCVVHPTVGLPLFLGSVALTSLAVHTAVMTHTNWMGNYWSGSKARTAENTGAAVAALAPQNGSAFSLTVTPVPGKDNAAPASFVITVAPTAPAATAASDTTVAPAATPVHTASVN